nr:MAG TPA: hypothetical protein [Caudoviricetes sp.]
MLSPYIYRILPLNIDTKERMFYNEHMDLRNYVLGGYDVEEKRKKLCDMIAKNTNEKLMDYLIRFIELAIKEWN